MLPVLLCQIGSEGLAPQPEGNLWAAPPATGPVPNVSLWPEPEREDEDI